MAKQDIQAAPNSCVNCKFEKTCGYSPLAMSLSKPPKRSERSYMPCPLGLMSARGNRDPRPFFHPKGFEYTPDEEIQLEKTHRATNPPAQWNHIVRLPFGDYDRVNRQQFDLSRQPRFGNQFVKLASGAWEMVENLTVIADAEEASR